MPAARVRAVAPDDNAPRCEQATAMREQNDEFAEWRVILFGHDGEGGVWERDIRPVLKVFAGFGSRLDALCRFLGGWKPWAGILLATLIFKSPENAPELLQNLLKLFGAGS